MSDVVEFTGITKLDIPAEKILRKALERGLSEVVICGFDENGKEYFASSQADGGDVVWHLRRAEWRLMQMTDETQDD